MRSTFRPNRICERQSSQNRHTGLKFSPKRENRALFIKLVHSALFRSCGTRFGQIAFVSVKVLKIVKLAQNSLQNGKTVRLPWKVPFYYNFHKKILQNALFRSCGERFGQIAFMSVKILKIVTLAWNSRQKGKTVRFSWKLNKTIFSGHAQHILGKSNFWAWKFSKSAHWPEILAKRGKQSVFMKIVQNALFRSCAALKNAIWPKTCCAWPEKSVLYNCYQKRTVFPIWGEFKASLTILRTLTLKNAIWPKTCCAWTWKERFVQFSWKAHFFTRLEENFSPVLRFWELWRSKMRFGQNVLRMT